MLNILSTIPVILLFIAFGCGTDNEKILGYDLTSPDVTFVLPDILREVSGLTYIDSTSFACIQDEIGVLFVYDAVNNKIKTQYSFNADGDYEGIARVNKTIYVLRSDGTLFEIPDYESNDLKLTSYITGIPANDNEGLCYDRDNNRLLIACKGKIGKGPQYKDKRAIYGFDLKTKTLTKEPVFDFDLQTIYQFALDNKVNLPSRVKKKPKITAPVINFEPSAISIHPTTNKLYLLSASDHLLFVFSMDGSIEHIGELNVTMFNQAEGITFFENGDMLITNEGQNKKPTLLRFNYTGE